MRNSNPPLRKTSSVQDRWLATAPRLVVETFKAQLETPRPQGNSLGRCLQPLRDSFDTDAVEPQQDDLGAFPVSHADGG